MTKETLFGGLQLYRLSTAKFKIKLCPVSAINKFCSHSRQTTFSLDSLCLFIFLMTSSKINQKINLSIYIFIYISFCFERWSLISREQEALNKIAPLHVALNCDWNTNICLFGKLKKNVPAHSFLSQWKFWHFYQILLDIHFPS